MANDATKGRGKQSDEGHMGVPASGKRSPDEELLAAGDEGANVPPTLDISPKESSLAVGRTRQFKLHANGKARSIAQATWESSDPTIVSISASGLAKGISEGAVTITATSGAGTASLGLEVTPAELQSIAVNPANPTLAVGEQKSFTAIGTYTDGTTEDLTQDVTWDTSDDTVATIDASGTATGITAGPATITAWLDNESGTTALTVVPAELVSLAVNPTNPTLAAGTSQQFTATGTYSDGTTNDLTASATWTSSATAVATINGSGVASGLAVGVATISAASAGVTATTTLSVSPAVVQSIAVSSWSLSVGAGQTRQFTAVAIFSDGSKQDVTANSIWTSDTPAVATINATGLATALTFGPTNIAAKYTDSNGRSFSDSAVLMVLVNFTDLGAADTQAFMNARSRVNQLLTAFERRGNLSDEETAQLQDGLELVTEFVNNNPNTPIPNFNAAGLGGQSDLSKLGIPFNIDPSKGPIGTGSRKANVIDDRFRAICDYLYGPPPLAGLEHDPGSFPNGNGPNPGGLTDDQLRAAAVYGYVEKALAVPPPYKTIPSMITSDDITRRAIFNQVVEAADAHFRTNRPLYSASLARLLQISQTPQIDVSTWAKVVDLLVQQGISAANPQINTWIDRAFDTAQNVGQAPVPSEINIDLPDLEQDVSNFEIISGNIFALQPAYFCSMLEELKVFQVVEKLVELFQNGILPVVRGDAGNLLFAYWKNAPLRVSEAERRGFYARALGFPGGDADSPNRDFKDLFMRFVAAVSSFVRQNTVDNLLRSNIPGAISQQQVRKSARDLATNISAHGYGIAYPMATELQKEINDVMAILKNDEVQNAYGAKDMWQLVDQVAGLELGGAKNSVKYRTMASAGATVFAWLANRARQLASSSYVPILDVAQLQNAPSYSTKPTTKPSDFDLVGACDQWLAVTGTQEDSVEQAAQPVEAPAMPSRPIQIPSVARDMLESVGVPAMAYSSLPGKGNGATYNWRYK
jgi:uncharacterized protein YjdB